MPSKSSKEMTLNEEWELMKQMADKQNAAITEAIEEHFKNKPRSKRIHPLFNGSFGQYNNINLTKQGKC